MDMMNANDGATSAMPAADVYRVGEVIPLAELIELDSMRLEPTDEEIWGRWSPESQDPALMGSPRAPSSVVPEEATCISCQTESAVDLAIEAWRLWKTGDESKSQVVADFATEDMLVDTARVDPSCLCRIGNYPCVDCPVPECQASFRAAQHGG